MASVLMKLYYVVSVPLSISFILNSRHIHPAYRMDYLRCLGLGIRMFVNTLRIQTATSYKGHLAMALKLLEMPPELSGDVVECGTWKGGSAANLSLVCRIVGRKLLVFDSFEGLPPAIPGTERPVTMSAATTGGRLKTSGTTLIVGERWSVASSSGGTSMKRSGDIRGRSSWRSLMLIWRPVSPRAFAASGRTLYPEDSFSPTSAWVPTTSPSSTPSGGGARTLPRPLQVSSARALVFRWAITT